MTNQEFLNMLNGLWDTELSESERKSILDESFEKEYHAWVNDEDEDELEEEEN